MSLLPSAVTCCDPCTEPTVLAIPGDPGADGAPGATGAAGVNAYTLTTAQFLMPDEYGGASDEVTVTVASSTWAVLNQVVAAYIGGGGSAFGYFEVAAKPSSTQMTLQNLKNTASGVYSVNSPVGTVFAIGTQISPAGLQGVSGTAASAAPVGATYIVQTPDATLSGEQALSALATGMLKNTTATGVLSIGAAGTDYYGPGMGVDVPVSEGGTGASNAAGAQTNLGLVIGTNVQAYDATLQSISALGTAADRYAYTTGVNTWAEGTITSAGRAILDDADAAAQRATLGVLPGYGLLTSSDAVDLNSATTDTSLTVTATRYLIDKVTLENPSAAVTTATAGLFTAAGGGGTTLCANQALSATLTGTTKIMHLAKQAIVDTDSRTDGTLYFRVGTAEGAARTVNVKIYGWKFA